MPIYEYQCQNCGHLFEELQSMNEEHLTLCPSCGKNELKRLLGAGSGVIFKGSGFYLTDYKKADKKSPAKPKESKTDNSADTKKDSAKINQTDLKKKD